MSETPEFELPEHDDWDDIKTPVMPAQTMGELMETLRSPGVETPTSDRVTRPIRPIALQKALEESKKP